MEHEVYFGGYFVVDTTVGVEIVTSDACGRTMGIDVTGLEMYVWGDILDPDDTIECREGWLARLSMPGYMDCTDWTVHATEADAHEYLDHCYGE